MSATGRRPGAGERSEHPGWPARIGALQVPAGVVTLRPVRMRDAKQWSRARVRDEDHLRPWEPTGSEPWVIRHRAAAWPAICVRLRMAARHGVIIPMVIEVDGKYAGQLTIGNIVRGPLRSAWIGYWVSTEFSGRRVASAAVALAVDHCLSRVGLHRLEATVRPENLPSRSVLRRAGFREEGLLRNYMDVDGAWRDHILVGMTTEDFPDTAAARMVRAGRARWH
ncbi:GNAT family N-acetyltransferase [Tomitella fengzijianii]|nr:GNAT family protein [Tomitella fengzijianii]